MNASTDRRQFRRAPFHSSVRLHGEDGIAPGELLDISLRGALVEVPEGWAGRLGDACRLELPLSGDAAILMEVVVAHLADRQVGLRCQRIDVDSITHLRRLVELNAGDPDLLDRELHVLLES